MSRPPTQYEEESQRLRKELRDEEQLAEDSRQLYEFFKRHREIVSCDANRAIINSYFGGDPLSQAALEDSLTHPALRERLAFVTEPVDREKLEEAIIELLTPAGSPNAIEGAKKSFRLKTTEELHAWKEELERKQVMRAKSIPELKELVRRPAHEFPPLPLLYQGRGGRSLLLDLANRDIQAFRSLIKFHGEAAINKVLARRGTE